MRRWTKIAIVTLLTLLASLPAGSAWAGGSKTHVVRPGESIQAAIDAAQPGDTILVKPGTYAEALVVTTDNLTLKGSRGTVLTMPDDAEPCLVFDPEAPPTAEGICVLGELSPEFEVTDPVEDTNISGFTIRGFSGNGIFALGTEGLRASHNRTDDNVEYGIFVLLFTRPVLAYNKASGNGVAGLYVGGNQEVDAKVFGNTTWDNPIGIFLRDVSHGTAEGNHVFGNCAGIVLLAASPGPVTDWKVRHNLVKANNRTDCGEEDPVPSGVGILLFGASDNQITENLVLGNRGARPTAAGSCWSPPTGRMALRWWRRRATPSARTPPSATGRSTSPGTAPAAATGSSTTAAGLRNRKAYATDPTILTAISGGRSS